MTAAMRIATAAGDGIGPEIMAATLDIFRAAGVMQQVEFVPVEMGKAVFAQGNTRGMTLEAIRTTEDCGILFKGPMETPSGGGGKSINVTARKLWSTFANLRHFTTLPGGETVYSKAGIDVSFHVVRENVEDTYGGVENRVTSDVVMGRRIASAPGADEVHRFAFQTARKHGIDHVHCIHKANIMKMTDGLFLERFRAAAMDFPEIKASDVIVDALCMNLVMRPNIYQMIVLPNLQGDIVSDLAAGLVGGLGFAPSANIGKHMAIFEAVHGTAPDIAGQDKANPTALLLSGLMLLRHIGLGHEAAVIENALLSALESGVRTGDFGDVSTAPVGTRAFAQAVIERLGARPSRTSPRIAPEKAPARIDRLPKPTHHEGIRTFETVVALVAGCDVYLETRTPPVELAEDLARLCEDSPLKLTMISNRGTQVWPTGSVFTECVDYYRARFEIREGVALGTFGQGPCHSLLRRIAERYLVASYELLRTFDGQRGYSLAQGQ